MFLKIKLILKRKINFTIDKRDYVRNQSLVVENLTNFTDNERTCLGDLYLGSEDNEKIGKGPTNFTFATRHLELLGKAFVLAENCRCPYHNC